MPLSIAGRSMASIPKAGIPPSASVEEAIRAYTMGSAYAGFEEKDRGSLEPGKLADVIILSRDILDPSERDHLADCTVTMTMVGGRVVYSK